MSIDDRDIPGCFNAHVNMLAALKIQVLNRLSGGEDRIDLSPEVALYLIERAQRWERLNHNMETHKKVQEL